MYTVNSAAVLDMFSAHTSALNMISFDPAENPPLRTWRFGRPALLNSHPWVRGGLLHLCPRDREEPSHLRALGRLGRAVRAATGPAEAPPPDRVGRASEDFIQPCHAYVLCTRHLAIQTM